MHEATIISVNQKENIPTITGEKVKFLYLIIIY